MEMMLQCTEPYATVECTMCITVVHSHTHAYMHTHIHSCTHAHTHTLMHTHIHSCTHAHTHTLSHFPMHTSPCTQQPGLLEFIPALLSCEQVASKCRQWRLHEELQKQFYSLVHCMTSDQLYSKFVPITFKCITGNVSDKVM